MIELLVVIAIIAILAAILLPALAAAKQRALTVQCTSNMKQLLTANSMYTNDNNDYLPLANANDHDKTSPGWLFDPTKFPTYSGLNFGPMLGTYWPYLHAGATGNWKTTGGTTNMDSAQVTAWNAYWCPADLPPAAGGDQTAEYNYRINNGFVAFDSYEMNYATESFGNTPQNTSRRYTGFVAMDVLLWVPDWKADFYSGQKGHAWNDGANNPYPPTSEGPGATHGNGEPLGFMDAHTEFWRYDTEILPQITAPTGSKNNFFY